MTTIREIAEKHAMDGWSGDAFCVSVADCEAALREFGEELAKLCEGKKIVDPVIPGYAAYNYNAALSKCALAIRSAIGQD